MQIIICNYIERIYIYIYFNTRSVLIKMKYSIYDNYLYIYIYVYIYVYIYRHIYRHIYIYIDNCHI